ncbi:MAG TPA: hypothetical protein VFN74_19190 [Chloroflexota bacterium]|nr:hypothetical protein [Chloroflexota bacterium]
MVLSRGMGGLPHDSIAFCEEVTTLDFDFLAVGPLGDVVPERVLHQAVSAIRRALGDVVLDD